MTRRAVLIVLWLVVGACSGLAATLIGRASDARGNALRDLRLLVLNLETVRKLAVATDEGGTFRLELEPGNYAVYTDEAGAARLLAQITLRPREQRFLELRLNVRGELRAETKEGVGQPDPHNQGQVDIDPALAGIRDYEVHTLSRVKGEAPVRALAEIVNPFAAKSGGRFHGSVYQFHRNDNFDAPNFFDPPGQALPEYKRNQFGFTAGAALARELNLFGTYDGLRIIQGSTLLSHVPTPLMKAGDFGHLTTALRDPLTREPLPGNRIPQSRIHPVPARLLRLLPDPNRPEPDRNFVNNRPVVRNRDTFSVRLDYVPLHGSNLFSRYVGSSGEDALAHALPELGSVRRDQDQEFAFSYSQKITNRWLATSRVEFGRNTDFLGSVNAGRNGLLESLGIAGLGPVEGAEEGYPDFRLSGYASFGDSGLPVTSTSNRLSFDVVLNFSPANHSVRLGGGITAHQMNDYRTEGLRRGRFSFNGYYSGDAFADFLFGVPDSAARGIGSDRADLRRKNWRLFGRDQWKLGSRLTLSFGLTYNYYPPYRSVHERISAFYPLLMNPPLEGEFVLVGSERASVLGFDAAGRGGLVFPDRNDWSPSIGVAYRPFGSNRLVLRGSFGISHSPLSGGYFASYLGRNFPFYYVETAQSQIDRAAIDLETPFTGAVVAELGVRGIEPHLRTGYLESWQWEVQTEAFQNWHFEASYDGGRGIHMPRVLYGNIPPPGPGAVQPRRPNPNYGRFTILTGSGAYTRHALELGAERRLTDGISIKSAFTWNHTLNDLFRGFPSNPRNLRAERSRADFIPTRELSLNYIVDLPLCRGARFLRDLPGWASRIVGGWRFSGITRLRDGYPFDLSLPGDANNDGVAEDRPDRLGSGELDPAARSIDSWFAVGDFAEPAPYGFGNAGRNILVGPGHQNWDISLIKQNRVGDGQTLEFRVELFNAFNHTNFDLPYTVFGTSSFGKIFGASRAREIELAVRYSF
jgi:hypothetical protein